MDERKFTPEFAMVPGLTIRFAKEEDCQGIFDMIYGLAEYEHMEDQMQATADDLRHMLFAEHSADALAVVMEEKLIGYSIFFHNASTFLCRKGLYAEDIYVKPEYRGRGIGTCILKSLAQIAKERNCGRLEWTCLDWNVNSQEFYKGMGAVCQPEWQIFRVTQDRFDMVIHKTKDGD